MNLNTGSEFVTQKIIEKVVSIKNGDSSPLELGNIDAERDWGYAKDYVEGMYLMLQYNNADDYVLATNSKIKVRKFVEIAFEKIGIKIIWKGEGIDEVGLNESNGKILVKINKEFFRPAEVDVLIGDFSKAKKILNWEPKTDLNEMIDIMINHCIKRKYKN